MMTLTKQQASVWRYIKDYYGRHGYRPSSATICKQFSFASPNSATSYLDALKAKGYTLPDTATLPARSDCMAEVKAWRKAYRGCYFDGKRIVDTKQE